ncbi:MAG: uncharacterized protein JWO86_513 [Myxococcaceae bacterium]|nr:uncharacterized protein [Myxococcaceae bacterium]
MEAVGWRSAASKLWGRARKGGRDAHQRTPKWLRVVLYAVVGAFVFYLLAANVLLRTHLLRGWLSKNETEMKVDYRSAWSFYPGHVTARDLSFRYSDSNIQMYIGIERAELRFDPFALTKHTIRISKLDADGATFLFRMKQESVEGSEARIAAFPPIDGFASPPIEHKVPKPPIPDDQYKLWTIELTEVTASLREVWTMELHYRGEGTLSGGFHLKPRRELWVYPSVMLTNGGVLMLGDRDLIRGGEGRLEAQIEPYDTRELKGAEMLRNLSARVHQRGELVLPSIAETYKPTGSDITVERGVGPFAIDAVIEHGVVQPETRVTFHTDVVDVKAPPVAVHSDLDVVGRGEMLGDRPSIVVESTVAHARATPQLDVHGVHALLDFGSADLSAPFAIARLSGKVSSAHCGNLHAWQPLAPKNVAFDSGAATASARGEYHGGALEGRVDLAVDKARMTFGDNDAFSFVTSGKAWTDVASEDVEKSVAFPGGGADLHDLGLKILRGQEEGLWMRARFDRSIATTSGRSGFDSDIGLRSGPGTKMLKLFTRMASLPDVAADATSGSEAIASMHVQLRPGDVSLAVSGKNGAMEGRGRIRKRATGGPTGAFLLSVGPFHAGLDVHDGDTSVVPLAGGDWLAEKLQTR